eukprot:2381349-Prymnesium_polylepis.2
MRPRVPRAQGVPAGSGARGALRHAGAAAAPHLAKVPRGRQAGVRGEQRGAARRARPRGG